MTTLRRVALAATVVAGVALVAVSAVILGAGRAVVPSSPGSAPLANPSVAALPAPHYTVPVTVRIQVPSVAIDVPVIEGDGVAVPLFRAMHYPGTDEPGAGSTSLFYAHGQKGMFYGLYFIKRGAEVRTVRADGSILEYRVRQIIRVPWDDLDILRATKFDQLLLLTCTSYNPYDQRYVVIATPM